ncbi:MAG: carboxypeptidase regulatory-like domain-containing protein [Chitinispirillaceae bacterium]|nr:carboxypeptidase regulatory-like domain-containing protein [Chitinispirillaceae bacterium]
MKISVNHRYLYVLTQITVLVFLNLTCTNDNDFLSLDETNNLQSSMSGTVIDKNSKGLSGVSVTAYPGGTTTMSNDDGTFALTGLCAGKSILVFRYADFTDTTLDTISLGLLESKNLKEPVRMRYRYGWICGNVTAGVSSIIDAGVQVENQLVSTRTLPGGSFTLSKVLPGRCKVYGSLRGVGYGLVEHEIKADDTSTITIAITNAGGTVQGKVVDATNNPVVGATVSVMNNVIVGTTDASGSYILTEVPGNGRLTLTVSKGSDTLLVSGVQVADSQSITIQNVKLLSIVQQGQLRILPAAVRTVSGKSTSILVSSAGSIGSSGIAWFDWDEDGNGTFDRRTPVPVDTGLAFTEGTHYVKVRAVGIDTTITSETITIEVTSISTVVTKKYQLLVDFDPSRGTVSPANGSFTAGSKIVLSVTTKNDYVFDRWGGDDSALIRGDTLYMPERNVALQAIFKVITPEIKAGTPVTDIDGNVYTTIIIGSQEWTVENLRTTTFNDGTPIQYVTDDREYKDSHTPAYCYYKDVIHADSIKKWGALYNGFAVSTGKLAPLNWRVPTDTDWDTLQNYLVANGFNWDGTRTGNKIGKSLASKTDWEDDPRHDLAENNLSGFSALPSGYHDNNSVQRGFWTYWWSTTKEDTSGYHLFCCGLNYIHEDLVRSAQYVGLGLSVRLVRDTGAIEKPDVDTIPPRIIIIGKQYDTVLVNTTWNYLDSVRIVDVIDPKPTYTKEPASISTTTENSFKITYIAKDSSGNIDTAYRYLVVMKPTTLMEKYNIFAAPKLPVLDITGFKSFTIEGTPPDLKNLKSLSFMWDGTSLLNFSFNYNGDPYFKSFTGTVHTLSSPKPQITLSGTGITGLDGKYYVVLNDKNFVWISEDGNFAITWIP